jgi:hypothetical protein
MQLQLSLKIADRLHHDLLVRGEPLPAADAAQILLGAPVAAAISVDVLEVLVRDDRRFCWTGAAGELLTLRSWQCGDPDLCTVPFVALDLETTGAKAGAGKITEVGAVRIEGMRIVDQFQTLVNPQRAIPPMITKITGITQSMVADAPRIEEVIPGLLEFLEGAVVVAHNAPFDVGFLNYELHRLRSRRLGDGAIDTLPLSRALVPGLVRRWPTHWEPPSARATERWPTLRRSLMYSSNWPVFSKLAASPVWVACANTAVSRRRLIWTSSV